MTELRQRMIEDLKIRNYAAGTIDHYVRQVAAFARHFRRSPDQLGPEEVRAYQVYLVEVRKLSYTALKQTVSGLRFFYTHTLRKPFPIEYIPYPRTEKRLPIILSRAEVVRLLESTLCVKHATILATMYAVGLRVAEVAKLRPEDIDSDRMMLRVQQGKGRKDRYVPLSQALLKRLRDYWKLYRPHIWLFPGQDSVDPITTSTIGKFTRQAADRAGILKRVSPHTLRHAYATHQFESGVELLVLQKILGHLYLSTTAVYTHVADTRLRGVPSPLDLLPTIPE